MYESQAWSSDWKLSLVETSLLPNIFGHSLSPIYQDSTFAKMNLRVYTLQYAYLARTPTTPLQNAIDDWLSDSAI